MVTHDTQDVAGGHRWAANIIRTCMGVQRGETLLVIVDEPLAFVRDALLAEALGARPAELWSYTFPDAARPFQAFPERLVNLAAEADAVVLLLADVDPVTELPAHYVARTAIGRGKSRYAVGAYINHDILAHEMSADYDAIAATTRSLAKRLSGSSAVRLTSPLGTDLRISTEGRPWLTDTGILRGRGVYGNLPAGEVYVAPVEDSAEGVLVIDRSLPGLMLNEPVRIVVERGRALQIAGGDGAAYLERAIHDAEEKPHGEWARTIAELGIGTNPRARLQGNIITDEKVAGTVHVAIGRNDMFGGRSRAPLHIDGVIGQPTLWVDGELLIDGGRLLPQT